MSREESLGLSAATGLAGLFFFVIGLGNAIIGFNHSQEQLGWGISLGIGGLVLLIFAFAVWWNTRDA